MTEKAKIEPGSRTQPALIEVECPSCGRVYSVGPELVGRRANCANCSNKFVVADDWHVGDEILGLYKVTGLLGEGGMGKVYKVKHLAWNLDLAVKSPKPELLVSPEGAAEFAHEAETWVKLGRHPNIVSCHYVRSLGGVPRVFAEFVEGGSLRDWIYGKRLYMGDVRETLARILDIGIQTAWGLHYSHERNLIHQDVKPGNVMMTPEGEAKITDFGLARARSVFARAATRSMNTLYVAGAGGYTPAYASPEQLTPGELTRRTDIWSWAVAMVEMFVGGISWNSANEARNCFDQMLGGWVGPGPLPPPRVTQLLRACLEPEADRRPRSFEDIATALKEEYEAETEHVYPRLKPREKGDSADDLNNRALSLMDLGKSDGALELWDQALALEPLHAFATFNRALTKWRSGTIGPMSLVTEIRSLADTGQRDMTSDYLAALVQMELGNYQSALETFQDLKRSGFGGRELEGAISTAKKNEPRSCRLVNRHTGSPDRITGVCLCLNGKRAITGSKDGTLKFWDVETLKCLETLNGHEGGVDAVCLSGDARWAMSGGEDNAFMLWDLGAGKRVRTFRGHAVAENALSLSHDGRRALSGSWDHILRVWDAQTGRLITECKGHTESVDAARLSADGRFALSGGADATVKFWDVSGPGRCLRTFQGHTDYVTSVALSADGMSAVSGSRDGTVRVWNAQTGNCLQTLEGHADTVWSVCVSADGRFVLSGSEDGLIKFWDAYSGRCLRTIETRFCRSVQLREIPGLAVSCGGKTICVWRLVPDTPIFRAPPALAKPDSDAPIPAWYDRHIYNTGFHLSNRADKTALDSIREVRKYASYACRPETLDMWRKLLRRFPRKGLRAGWRLSSLLAHDAPVNCLHITRDGSYVVSGGEDATLKLWDPAKGELLRSFEGHSDAVWAVCLTEDAKLALSASWDKTLKLWKIDTGECVRTFTGHTDRACCLCMSHDGGLAVSGGFDGTMRLWDVRTGRCLRTVAAHDGVVRSVSMSRDGRFALTGGADGCSRLWDISAGKRLRTLQGHQEGVSAVCLSHDGRYALSASRGPIKLWDTGKGVCVNPFSPHRSIVCAARFTPYERFALSGSVDKTVRLWDVGTGNCVKEFVGHTDAVRAVSVSQDGNYAVSGDGHGVVFTWYLDWEIEDRPPSDAWDEGAESFMRVFLTQRSPAGARLPQNRPGLPRRRKSSTLALLTERPSWTNEDLQDLFDALGHAGFGWLKPEDVERRLKSMAASWEGPPPLDNS